ncbi:GNAT family N-acetyltransferase [Streptomyces sp. KS 21]|uniref:GNAT family N-acetyltransferase n=1 Tax=Streptomyces sp. KS 21 TaxID=2485150 RepID=UPI0010629CFB|nr:GNAT family N-acetyltransferase [Streptomyces sp. KS 21]TDU67857.1 acetyltransferase (GNAT) family protein [Streptomyces sp. KS 21]
MAKRIKKRTQPRTRHIPAQRVIDGWPEQAGAIRRIRPGEWARANELLPAAGVQLDRSATTAIDNNTLGTVLLDGLATHIEGFHEHFLDSLKGQDLVQQLVPCSLVLVAEDASGQIIGVCEVIPPATTIMSMRSMGYPDVMAMMLAVTVGKVRGLAVDEDVRGQGWGSALLRRTMQVYDQLGFVALEGSFDVGSPHLEAFYRGHGFEVLDVGGKVQMDHLGPVVQIGSDDSERMFVRHRDTSHLPWSQDLARARREM